MCGIVGVIIKANNGLTKRIEDSFYNLLFVNTLRGDDSTGVIAVEKTTEFHVMKEATEAAWFIPQFQYSPVGKQMWTTGKALIGHNRKGTMGKVEDANAHPFVVDDDFAMVHNGTLLGHHKLAATTVDSEALAIVLAKAFKEEDYKKALEEILPEVNGAYAVSIYDQRHNTVRLLRNKERPMAYVETSDAWFFASEGLMLHWILSRNGYTAKDVVSLKAVPEDTVVTFDLDANTCTEEKITIKKYTPPLTMVQGGATPISKKTIPVMEFAELSKTAYKRLRKSLMGTKVEWWVDDYIEAGFPKTYDEGETVFNIMGSSSKIDFAHTIHATVDVNELRKVPDDLIDKLWCGVVAEMTYNTGTQSLSIYLTEAYPLPVSFKKKQKPPPALVIDADYIQRKLDEQEKAINFMH